MRIAVAAATDPLVFETDHLSGIGGGGNGVLGFINPGHRLAIDPESGAVYSLFQNLVGAGAGGSKNINYVLNRSTDGGQTWTLNGSATVSSSLMPTACKRSLWVKALKMLSGVIGLLG